VVQRGYCSPWNAPLVLGIRSIAIPLAVGNTVVMKLSGCPGRRPAAKPRAPIIRADIARRY
jgi:hypothetical protein